MRNGTIDLLLTDVMMPGSINGRQLAVEALLRRPSLKVLYTSGYSKTPWSMTDISTPAFCCWQSRNRKIDLAKMIRAALAA